MEPVIVEILDFQAIFLSGETFFQKKYTCFGKITIFAILFAPKAISSFQECFVKCGNSSVGRASASQAEGREFESRFPLKKTAVAAGYGGLSFQDRKLAFNGLK